MNAISAFVFDAYGTLFDVNSVAATAEAVAPRQGGFLSQVWRTKQLEYSWLQSIMLSPAAPRDDFAALTEKALDYALSQLTIHADAAARTRLLDAWLGLAPFADAADALASLAPRPRWILSNGTRAMLEPLVAQSSLVAHVDGLMSVDDAGIYKPSPRVYQLAVDRLGLAPGKIGFVSANGWDAAGAKASGFTTFWINRNGLPVERHAAAPDYVLGSLAELAALAP
ncbi:MAG: haloacid dehalogenase type II [Proteobacteria bacterium]|jgi:2-haloacid dehalogenase|nr:haloacid dehalogenase type II [Pseudomonadota bacterium]